MLCPLCAPKSLHKRQIGTCDCSSMWVIGWHWYTHDARSLWLDTLSDTNTWHMTFMTLDMTLNTWHHTSQPRQYKSKSFPAWVSHLSTGFGLCKSGTRWWSFKIFSLCVAVSHSLHRCTLHTQQNLDACCSSHSSHFVLCSLFCLCCSVRSTCNASSRAKFDFSLSIPEEGKCVGSLQKGHATLDLPVWTSGCRKWGEQRLKMRCAKTQ